MKETYIEIVINNRLLVSTVPSNSEINAKECAFGMNKVKNADGKIISWQYKIALEGGYLFLLSTDNNITTKIFQHYCNICDLLANNMQKLVCEQENMTKKELQRLQHNVNSYNATIKDQLTSLISLDEMQADFMKVVNFCADKVKTEPKQAAITILKSYKQSVLIDAEMMAYDYMSGDNSHINADSHNIHKVIKLSLQPYYLDFLERGITIQLGNTLEKVIIDYPTISVVFGHLWNNAVKYAKRNSTIVINFNEIVANMPNHIRISLEMDSIKFDEVDLKDDNVFKEGYSGVWAKKAQKAGHGIGMYFIKRLLELNHGIIEIIPGKEMYFDTDDICYTHNIFNVYLNK